MPASISAARSDASRQNGSLSSGPVTPEGKARSARNGTKHNLHGPFRLLDGEDAAAFEALHADLRARNAPVGEAEEHWCDELASAYWRQRRLFALEDAALTAPLAEVAEGTDRLPSLATLARYRARVERDLRLAQGQLDALRAERPRAPSAANAAQLRWLLARAEEAAARASGDGGTDEPEPLGTTPADPTGPATPAVAIMSDGTPEPEAAPSAPAGRALNRHERRRLATMRRRGIA